MSIKTKNNEINKLQQQVDSLEGSQYELINLSTDTVDILDYININSTTRQYLSKENTKFTNSPYTNDTGLSYKLLSKNATIQVCGQPLDVSSSTEWFLSNAYVINSLVIKDGIYYKANANIPVNTNFTIGTTGATWRIFNQYKPFIIIFRYQNDLFNGVVDQQGSGSNGDPIYTLTWRQVETFEIENKTDTTFDLGTLINSTSKILTFEAGTQFIKSPYPQDANQIYATISVRVHIEINSRGNQPILLTWKDFNKKIYFGTFDGSNIKWTENDDKDEYKSYYAYQDFTNVVGTSLVINQNQNFYVNADDSSRTFQNITNNQSIIINSVLITSKSNPANNIFQAVPILGTVSSTRITATNQVNANPQNITLSAIPHINFKDDVRVWFRIKLLESQFPKKYDDLPKAQDTDIQRIQNELDLLANKYKKEHHFDTVDGDDVNGDGSLNKPYKTPIKSHEVATNAGEVIYGHAQIVSDNFTITKANLDYYIPVAGGIGYHSGKVTVFNVIAGSSNRLYGVSGGQSLDHTGIAGLYLFQCQFPGIYKTNIGYLETNNGTDLENGVSTISGGGINVFKNTKLGDLNLVGVTGAICSIVANCTVKIITITAGNSLTLNIEDSTVFAPTPSSFALNGLTGNTIILKDVRFINASNGTLAKINIPAGCSYSFSNVQYDRVNSTINGTDISGETISGIYRSTKKSTLNGIDNIGVQEFSSVLTLANFSSGGSIGSAANTVDKFSMIKLGQTTANQLLTLPNPSRNAVISKYTIIGSSVNSFVNNFYLPANQIIELQWSDGAYRLVGDKTTGDAKPVPVLTNLLATPPANPVVGDAYIVPSSANGIWLTRINNIAFFTEKGWSYYVPVNKDKVLITAGANAGGVATFNSVLNTWLVSPSGVPIGSIMTLATDTVPTGYFPADGRAISRTEYPELFSAIGLIYGAGTGSTTFPVPDLRGVFIRGLDNGRGLDPGRALGSYQDDLIKNHRHVGGAAGWTVNFAFGTATGYGTRGVANLDLYNSEYPLTSYNEGGGSETRPKNVALFPIIKY